MSKKIIQDVDKAIFVMHDAGKWLEDSGKNPSKWWKPENLNREFLLQYAKPEEFYTVLIDSEPAAAIILQVEQAAQDWKSVDGNNPKPALYMHWGAVARKFAGQGLTKVMFDYAEDLARKNNVKLIRLDTDADIMKLREIYQGLGFELVGVKDEGYRKTAFYEKKIK